MGSGATTYSNGDVHTGGYRDNRRSGHGVMAWAEDGRRYEGDYEAGRRHGRGVMHFPNGDEYTGEWDMGRRTGK